MKPSDVPEAVALAKGQGVRLQPAAAFWAAFRARAAAAGQLDASAVLPAGVPQRAHRAVWVAGPVLAAAAGLVAMLWFGNRVPGSPDAVQAYRLGEDVVHGGIMILNDEPSHATILWIVDLGDNA